MIIYHSKNVAAYKGAQVFYTLFMQHASFVVGAASAGGGGTATKPPAGLALLGTGS